MITIHVKLTKGVHDALATGGGNWKIGSTTEVLSWQGGLAEAMLHAWAVFTSTQGKETDPARTSRFLFRITGITFS